MTFALALQGCTRGMLRFAFLVAITLMYDGFCLAQATQFRRTFAVSRNETMLLDVDLPGGHLQIAHSHEGEVSIAVDSADDKNFTADLFSELLVVKFVGNQIEIRQGPASVIKNQEKISYTIDVPYRTEVRSLFHSGQQTITGVMGPVAAQADRGDIHLSYVTKAVSARTGAGNLSLEVIGERADAVTQTGNISCSRIAQGVSAETGSGDISMMVIGPSIATVDRGTGRIEAGGVRGTLAASTDAGDLNVKAVPHDDWRLSSLSGSIRVELPAASSFDLDVMTGSGDLVVTRNDLEKPHAAVRKLNQKANGGGKRIEIRSESGRIVVG